MLVLFSTMFTNLQRDEPDSTGTSLWTETGCVWVAPDAAICGDLQCGGPHQCVDSDHAKRASEWYRCSIEASGAHLLSRNPGLSEPSRDATKPQVTCGTDRYVLCESQAS